MSKQFLYLLVDKPQLGEQGKSQDEDTLVDLVKFVGWLTIRCSTMNTHKY
jgi:hypothetical protein